jgi:hypothetical protein
VARAGGWLRVALALGIYAGLRSGEIRALQVGDVDLDAGVIRVVRTLSAEEEEEPKGDKDRIVPTYLSSPRSCVPRSTASRARRASWSPGPGQPRAASTSFPGWSSFSALAGHGSIRVTNRYVHATAADLQGAMERGFGRGQLVTGR